MVRSKSRPQPSSRNSPADARSSAAPPTVSARWLLSALAISIPAAIICTWAALCLLFWQGSWQLLYHPTSAVAHAPAEAGLAYDSVSFATTDAGVTQLQGWWLPAPTARYTALFLHDRTGNVGDTIHALAELHDADVNVLAFDYRGYGQSHFERPNEARWLQDAAWALNYLTGTRHIDPHSILMVGSGLGANLALEVAAARPDLAGVVLESPLDAPVNVIFNDTRAKLVPAHLLVRDRYDLNAPATRLRIPSLWLVQTQTSGQASLSGVDVAFEKVTALKQRVAVQAGQSTSQLLTNWLSSISENR